jgi:hypothetical protein
VSGLDDDRHAELCALRVERPPLPFVERDAEAERVDVGGPEAEVPNGALQLPHALHAGHRVDPGHADDAVRMVLRQAGDVLVGEVDGHRAAAVVRLLERRHHHRPHVDLVQAGHELRGGVGDHVPRAPPALAHHEVDLLVVEEDLPDATLVERVAPGVDRGDVEHAVPRADQ